MTSTEDFGKWLASAMRDAGLDVDAQRGGGRNELAKRVGVAKSTVSRWLDGDALPRAEHFVSIADAVDAPISGLLRAAGIVDPDADETTSRPSRSPQQIVAELGITDPDDAEVILAMARRLKAHRAGRAADS